MGALTKEFLIDFESNLRSIVESSYAGFTSNLWWSRFMKRRSTQSRKETVAWLLSTAQIREINKMGGEQVFEDLVQTYAEYEMKAAAAGLRMDRFKLEDLDGGGIDIASKWAADIGAYMAYWPQKKLADLIKNGATSGYTSYDGVTFFNNAHPVNPAATELGTFANVFTGAAASTPSTDAADAAYPGAAPIDDSVSLDTALTNLSKVVAYIKSIRMPNGEDPRFLRPTCIVAPPRMQQRVVQLTGAKFLGGSAGGTNDVEKLIASFGLDLPVIADELAAGLGGSDTTWYLACEEAGGAASQVGSFLYLDREPFKITYYTGQGGGTGVDAVLDRADELEWHCKGRFAASYGHPYTFFQIKAT
jgi:phage major head subunit gpT-like protein